MREVDKAMPRKCALKYPEAELIHVERGLDPIRGEKFAANLYNYAVAGAVCSNNLIKRTVEVANGGLILFPVRPAPSDCENSQN